MKNLDRLIDLENEAKQLGFKWSNINMILEQIHQETNEIASAIDENESDERIQEEVGDLLHALVSLTQFLNLDIDKLLGNCAKKFSKRLNALKIIFQKYNINNPEEQDIEFLIKCWNEAKDDVKDGFN